MTSQPTSQINLQMLSSEFDVAQAGSDNRPPMLVKGLYTQWVNRMRRFIEDKPDVDLIWNSIEQGPYIRGRHHSC